MLVQELQAELKALEVVPIAVDPELLQGMEFLLKQEASWKHSEPEELRAVLNHLLLQITVGRGGEPIIPIRRPY